MGAIITRLKGKQSKVEALQELEKGINAYQEKLSRMEQQRHTVVSWLVLNSAVVYVALLVFCYFYWTQHSVWPEYLLLMFPALGFPLLVWVILRLIQFLYRRMLKKRDQELAELKKKKMDILNQVKETETYKTATEILEKFDPDYQKSKKEEKIKAELREYELRRRALSNKPNTTSPALPPPRPHQTPHLELTAAGRLISFAPYPPPLQPNANFFPSNKPPRQPWGPPARLNKPARPIPNKDRTIMDRFLDMLAGDGPSNRFALICTNCYGHNGMALKEEFEYVAFKCCYCMCFNPSRKQRPHAPKLSSIPALPAIESPDREEEALDSEVSEASSSQANSTAEPKVESPPSPTPSVEEQRAEPNGAIITECSDESQS